MALPWLDIQDYGATPKPYSFNEPSAQVALTAHSQAVTIPPGPFLSALRPGQGICVPQAGPPTTQSLPVAPTATSPATSGSATLTYCCVGYDSRGGLTAASPNASVSGAAIGPQHIAIKSVSRDATGRMTIETTGPHGFRSQPNSLNQTLVNVEGCQPFNINGRFVAFRPAITSFDPFPTPTTIILLTDRLSAATGTLSAASLVSVWGFVTVACPPLAGPTIGYYIYSNTPNPASPAMTLIGKCPLGERHFTDWGQDLAAGYRAPGYVPLAPPASAQNQMFTTTMTSSTQMSDPSPTTMSGAMLFDDGVNLLRAVQDAAGGVSGCVLISPPRTSMRNMQPGYIFNSPITFPEFINVEWGCKCIINETLTWTYENEHDSKFGSTAPQQGAQFGQRAYTDLGGIASPMFSIGEDRGNSGAVQLNRLGFTCHSNGQVAVLVRSAFFTKFKNCSFMAHRDFGTAVGMVCLGGCTLIEFENTSWQFTNKYQSNNWTPGPPLPALWFRSSDNPNIPNGMYGTNQVLFRGNHTFTGRAILFDHLYAANPQTLSVKLGDFIWNQAASTPMVMCWGQQFIGIDIHGTVLDTSQEAVIANWSTFEVRDVTIRNCSNNLQPLTTGKPIVNLSVSASSKW